MTAGHRRKMVFIQAVAVILAVACGGGDTPIVKPLNKPPTVAASSVRDGDTDVVVDAGRIVITWSIPVEVADAAKITMSNGVALQIQADNLTLTLTFGSLKEGTEYTLDVAAGAVLSKNGGLPNEAFRLSFTTKKPVENPAGLKFDIDPAPTNSAAGPEAVALYNRMRGWFGSKCLSGSMAQYTVGTESNDWVAARTGKNTAIACFDFMNVTRREQWQSWDRPYSELVTNAKKWAAAGGVVSCMWHWRDPSGVTDEFYCDPADGRPTYTTFDASDIFKPQSEGYKRMMAEIDVVAGYLAQLRDEGIAVLWRPLHEAQGNRDEWGGAWFWWGNGSGDRAAACVELWRVMYDRMTRTHGLDNLIWVWTNSLTGTTAWYEEGTKWYPGGDVVDIIGIDIYDADETVGRASHLDQFKKTAQVAGLRKMVALTECGYIPDAQKMFAAGDTWLWYMPWNGDFTEKTNGEYWATSFAYSRILTREDI